MQESNNINNTHIHASTHHIHIACMYHILSECSMYFILALWASEGIALCRAQEGCRRWRSSLHPHPAKGVSSLARPHGHASFVCVCKCSKLYERFQRVCDATVFKVCAIWFGLESGTDRKDDPFDALSHAYVSMQLVIIECSEHANSLFDNCSKP